MKVLYSLFLALATAELNEHERMAEYAKRNYSWPLSEYVPNTPGWKNLCEHRFRQVAEIDGWDARYEGYLQTINSALMAPNFTEHGFGLARAPDDLMESLRQGIRDGLDKGPRLESQIKVIEGLTPWFIDRPDLTQRVSGDCHHCLGFFSWEFFVRVQFSLTPLAVVVTFCFLRYLFVYCLLMFIAYNCCTGLDGASTIPRDVGWVGIDSPPSIRVPFVPQSVKSQYAYRQIRNTRD
jgi:hypothetical protein